MKSVRGDEKLWCSFLSVVYSVNFPIFNNVLLIICFGLSKILRKTGNIWLSKTVDMK